MSQGPLDLVPVYVPYYRAGAPRWAVSLYSFLHRSMLMTNLHIAWYLLVGPIAGAATLYTYALAVYVLAIGFDRGNPDLFPWLFWGGVFLSIYIPILTDLTDHRNPQVHSYPVLGILLLLSTGVAGLLWAYLWAKEAFWLQARYLPWVYDLMTTPWYWGTVGVLSAARVVGALLWAWVVEYKPVYRGAQGLTAREEGGRKEREEEEREVGTVITGHLDPKEAARNPTAEERQAVFWRLRQQLVLPPEAEQEIVELILLLRHHEAYRRQFGSDVPKGVLLVGPPGTGKTSIARFLANESGFGFVAATPGELRSKWLGESARLIGKLFAQARKVAPAVVFVDELDAVAPRRGGHGEVDHAVGQLLQELDGIKGDQAKAPLVFVGASNHPGTIDPAVMSRIGLVLTIPLPGKAERIRILEILLRESAYEVNLDLVAGYAEGFSGRDLKTVVTRASRAAFTEGRQKITTEDLVRQIALLRRGGDGVRS